MLASPNLNELEIRRSRQCDKGHGRVEHRSIEVCDCPAKSLKYLQYESVRQVFVIRRERVCTTTGELTCERVLGLTSAPPDVLDAAGLLEANRGHWTIENRSHHVRDVTMDEDRNRARTGSLPVFLAMVRCLALNLIRLEGRTNVAATLRQFAALPNLALLLIFSRTE